MFVNAFISWKRFNFIYRDGFTIVPGDWHGDGRGFTSSHGDISKNLTKTRGYNHIVIDVDETGKKGTVVSNTSASNYTEVKFTRTTFYGSPTGFIIPKSKKVTLRATAAAPAKATIDAKDNGNFEIEIDVASAMPLDPTAPDIDWEYKIKVNCKGKIEVEGKVDDFPWHEIVIYDKDKKKNIIQGHYAPAPGNTPANLLGGPSRVIEEEGTW